LKSDIPEPIFSIYCQRWMDFMNDAEKLERKLARIEQKRLQKLENEKREQEFLAKEAERLAEEEKRCKEILKGAKLKHSSVRSAVMQPDNPSRHTIEWREHLYLLGKQIWILYRTGQVPIYDDGYFLNSNQKHECMFLTPTEVSAWITETTNHPTEIRYLNLKILGQEEFQ